MQDLQSRFNRIASKNDGFDNGCQIDEEDGDHMSSALKKALKMIKEEFDQDNYEAWIKCSSKVEFVFELL